MNNNDIWKAGLSCIWAIIITLAILFYFLLPCRGAPVSANFFQALHAQEASGRLNPPDGDGGKAIGPFQIWRVYWRDAIEYQPSIGGTYQDCRKLEYAKKVVTAYLNRYCKKAVTNNDFQTMARIHNAGPYGARKDSSLRYWSEFKQKLR